MAARPANAPTSANERHATTSTPTGNEVSHAMGGL
jgi:hypothetical protein